jgi:hypothetical protein
MTKEGSNLRRAGLDNAVAILTIKFGAIAGSLLI